MIYYPNGALGKGRTVPDLATKEALFKYHKLLSKVFMFAVMPYAMLLGLSGNLSALNLSPAILIAAIMILGQYNLIRNLPKHDKKLTVNEAMDKGAKIFPNWYYWVLGVSSVFCILLALSFPIVLNKTFIEVIEIVLGLSGFGLLGLLLSIKLYHQKNK